MNQSISSDTGSSEPIEADVILRMNEEYDLELPINIRPHFKNCILELKKYYQVIIFTASEEEYADTIINYLDPTDELIEHRVYRQNCITTKDRSYIKDLRIFEDQWELKDIIIVDNLAKSFTMQTNNGIPILPFYSNKNDMELVHLTHFLIRISQESDVRFILKRTYWLELLYQQQIRETIGGDVEYTVQEIDDTEYEKLQQIARSHSTRGSRCQKSFLSK